MIGNARLQSAIIAARIERTPETICEIYDALNARRNRRSATLTDEERATLEIRYLRREAPDLIKIQLNESKTSLSE